MQRPPARSLARSRRHAVAADVRIQRGAIVKVFYLGGVQGNRSAVRALESVRVGLEGRRRAAVCIGAMAWIEQALRAQRVCAASGGGQVLTLKS